MSFDYNPYIWIYLVSAAILMLTVAYSIYCKNKEPLWLITLSLIILWCLGYAFQISGTDVRTASFWYVLSNDVIGLKSPTTLLLWSLVITGRKKLITPASVGALLLLPVATDILNLTNASHSLVYRQMWMDASSGYPLLQFIKGPWYWAINVYCMLELLAVVALLIKAAFDHRLLYRMQGYAIAAVVFVILMFIVVALMADSSILNYDLTPVVISIVVSCSSFAFRFRMQEAIPVPRKAVIEKMTSAVLILDNRDRIMDMNKAAEEFFGFKSGKVCGFNIKDVLSDWPELVSAKMDKSVNYCEFSQNDRFYKAYFSSLSYERKSAGSIVIIQDITDYKMIEIQAQRQKQALIALQERNRLARELHDSLGQVLGYINMQIQLIRSMLPGGDTQAIDNSLASLSKVVEEANTEVREFIYEVKSTQVFKDGFFSSLDQYVSHIRQKFNVEIKIDNSDGLTDSDIGLMAGVQLFRIIQESITNVRKHACAKDVNIVFRRDDKNITVSVSDDGMGFNPQNVNTEMSFGLEVMRERAKNIGGDLRIESAPGCGTTVTVALPSPSARLADENAGGTTTSVPRIRVLLADDHALFMDGLQSLIEPHGFEVVGTARDGLEAVEKARILRPDMILMDLQMPRCNGITATRLISMEMPEIKIIILTMSDKEYDLFEALKNGASGYLLKGLRTEDFIEQLCRLAENGIAISPETASKVMEELKLGGDDEQAASKTHGKGNRAGLSDRQIEILSFIAKGHTYKEVAAKLFISERTVKYQMSDILKLFNVRTRAEAISYAREHGILM